MNKVKASGCAKFTFNLSIHHFHIIYAFSKLTVFFFLMEFFFILFQIKAPFYIETS